MNIGDTVRFLNSTGGGIVRRIQGQMAYVEDEDGFEVPALVRECVVVSSPGQQDPAAQAPHKTQATQATPTGPTAQSPQKFSKPATAEAEETPGGDSLNLVMAFAASDLKRLSDAATSYDLFLVNDSNYFLAYTIASRADDDTLWTPLAQGLLEPNMQEFIVEITRDMLPDMDRLAIQYVAFKQGKPYAGKAPGAIDIKLDTTKFFKLHCFRPSDFFDEPVLEKILVKDDVPIGRHDDPVIASDDLRRSMMEKKRLDRRAPRPVVSKPSATNAARATDPLIVDLHITELVDSTRGLTNADMLNLQVDRFRQVMDANLRNHGRKLIFIHGKGEGVLRAAIIKELNHRYKGNDVQDASFREYGYGATQVTIR